MNLDLEISHFKNRFTAAHKHNGVILCHIIIVVCQKKSFSTSYLVDPKTPTIYQSSMCDAALAAAVPLFELKRKLPQIPDALYALLPEISVSLVHVIHWGVTRCWPRFLRFVVKLCIAGAARAELVLYILRR